jgi:hypothetical protein
MSKRQTEIPRRQALTTIAAAAVAAPISGQQQRQQKDPQHKHEGMVNIKPPAVYQPRFFSKDEFETVAVLVDLIIPKTNTPGARDANAHRIIDSSVRPREKAAWRGGLKWLASERFATLTQEQQIALLTKASNEKNTAAGRFFRLLKGATVDAYYNTREGLVTELGWNANTFLPEFKGCTHPEHQG